MRNTHLLQAVEFAPLLLLAACMAATPAYNPPPEIVASRNVGYASRGEVVPDFGALVPEQTTCGESVSVRLERVSAGVPWPRGLALVDGEILVLARGRHRRAGGVDHSIEDFTGTIFRIDPEVAEPRRSG